jgi:proline dehydrogenase
MCADRGQSIAMAAWRRRLLFTVATSDRFEWGVRRVPALERAAYRRALRYVAGAGRDDAFEVAQRLSGQRIAASLDFFGEQVTDEHAARAATLDYVKLARDLGGLPSSTWLAIDLSHIGLDISRALAEEHLLEVAAALPEGRAIQVGAEDAARNAGVNETILSAHSEGAPVWATVQANLREGPDVATLLSEAGVPVRLVKGAYVEAPAISHPWGEPTDRLFLDLVSQLAEADVPFSLATHDPVLREACLERCPGTPIEMLLGVREADARSLAARGLSVRLYVPYGQDWFRYFMRRLAEAQGSS